MYNQDSGNPQDDRWYNDMRRSFDERKAQWDADMQKMRSDFFTNSHGPQHYTAPIPSFPADRPPVETSYVRSPTDNRIRFMLRFHLPPQIGQNNLQLSVKDDVLTVTGRSEESANMTSHSSEVQRSITLPKGVLEHQITAVLTVDHVLVIECPIEGETPTKSSVRLSTEPVQLYHPAVTDSLGVTRTDSFDVRVPLGEGYEPNEVEVRLMGNRLYINAMHEERRPSSRAFREFSKEFDVPNFIDPDSIKAEIYKGVLRISAAPFS
ncbi:hypothetical protein Ciccas_005768 [Cichlidogyrus casuarinus]|uniref:SHSP domain-containing protein n=1 Tax=Cichlidogyrus casuarinus TaxID=1844966 RepID=A0ABD2Q7S2_9PLAT